MSKCGRSWISRLLDFVFIGAREITTIRLATTPFRQQIPINPQLENCRREIVVSAPRIATVLCTGVTILNDGDLGPEQSDLVNPKAFNEVAVWLKGPLIAYHISFELSLSVVSAMDIHLLNHPADNNWFGVPNFQLYRTSNAIVVYPEIAGGNTVEEVIFDLLNNDQLSRFDQEIKRITLQPRRPISASEGILLRWTFTDLYNIRNLGISEIAFRNASIVFMPEAIQFQSPATTQFQAHYPSLAQLKNGYLELICTVASQGLFTWLWMKGRQELQNSNGFSIMTTDGTRTSLLVIYDLNINYSGVYSCTASMNFPGISSETRTHVIAFPGEYLPNTLQIVHIRVKAVAIRDPAQEACRDQLHTSGQWILL
jgi:hypothetical protein